MAVYIDSPDALIAALGIAASIFAYHLGKNRRPKTPVHVCGCGHGLSFHKDGKGRCHATEQIKQYSGGVFLNYTTLECRCQIYSGPLLLDTFAARDLLPPNETDT